ncbi:polysaccharide lyase family 8 super-sandwich domain-containing protein [Ruania zhangjianzhongii]|uniref:polysaccharide lyase family 8 super-sandwich domain-containing protein n=1 Tax=Ruania zhangjianzhongii TaxID=2603206 RepID=UPI0011CAD04C|nr:polysaccharide lyase family 8 super-sandwich domain-containing protein [Ruania zhangjianzhongii]
MRSVSRRTVLTAAGVTALAATLPKPQIAFAAGPGAGAPAADRAALLANIVAGLAGTEETNAAAAVQPKLTDLYETATDNLDSLIADPTTALFPGRELGSDDGNLETTFQKLYEIAVATVMPVPDGATVPTDLYQDADARQQVIDALRWLYDTFYSDTDAGYYGNWYNWEIGIPTHVSRILALLHDDIASADPDLAQQYVDTMDRYLRNGKDGDVDLDSRFHTGANLADITTNRIVQGAVLDDADRITKAISDQLTVYQVIDPYHLQHGVTDGFYADGSFLMHSSVAYTGSYGIGLLERVTTTIAILDGTSFPTEPGLQSRINEWLATSFGPVIVEGWMMEIIKGRSVSRTKSGYDNGTAVVESVVALSRFAEQEPAAELAAYVAYLHGIEQMDISPSSFANPANIVAYTETVEDPDVTPANLVPEEATFAYNAMDRHVHHRSTFTYALARSSARVSKYEYMSGENLRPWFQGDGAHYLYLTGDDQNEAFGVDYFTAVDADRLAGVTAPVEERETVPELYGELFYDNEEADFTPSSVKQNLFVYFPLGTNAYSGGTTLGTYAVAGMQQADDAAYVAKQAGELPEDFVVYANSRSSKSWFMFDDEIVVLASGITDEHDRGTITTVDARISDPGDEVRFAGATRSGASVASAGTMSNLAWLHYANATRGTAIGYVFYTDHELDVRIEEVERGRDYVRTSNSDTPITKTVFDVSETRDAGAAPGSMAYAIVPGAGADALSNYADAGPQIVQHSEEVHAVRHPGLDLLAVNTFSDGEHEIENLTVDGPASVIAQSAGRGTTIAVSDPTFSRETVSVTIRGRRPVLDADPEVTVHPVRGGTRLDFRTHEAYGASFTVSMRGRGIA